MLALGGASVLSFAGARAGDLTTAGDAGDKELEDVEEAAGRFLGLLSLSAPVFAELRFAAAPSAATFFGFCSLAVAPCRGANCSAPLTGLLLSPACEELLSSACDVALG